MTSAARWARAAGGGRCVFVVTEPSVATSDERPKVATGRAVRERKLRVDEALAPDLIELRRRGLLAGPNGASITWTQPAGLGMWAEVTLALLRGAPVAFVFERRNLSVNGPMGAASTGVVSLTATRPHLGGWRWWFACPLPLPQGEGVCGRRSRILYLRPGDQHPGCRLCLRLTYTSRQRSRNFVWERCERPLRRNGRLMRDLLSRSRRRRFQALVAVDPEGTAAAIGVSVETVFALRRLARGSRHG